MDAPELAQRLVELGADVNSKNEEDIVALNREWAKENGISFAEQ